MKYRMMDSIQIGDIQAFNKMIADAINQDPLSKSVDYSSSKNYQSNFPYNDKHYQSAKKVDIADS